MSTTIALRPPAIEQAVSDVYRASRLLHDSTHAAGRQVAGLLADWQGPAATSFASAFDEWCRAAAACIRALEDIGASLATTDAGLLGCDGDTDRALTRMVGLLDGAER